MIDRKIVLDTGPLVAFLNRNDFYHDWAKIQLEKMIPPLFTCEAVVSEACFLLRNYEDGASNVLNLLQRGVVILSFSMSEEIDALQLLINKYKDIPMAFADGCLVRMAERIKNSAIFTFDSDFKIYRKEKNKAIPVIMPDKL